VTDISYFTILSYRNGSKTVPSGNNNFNTSTQTMSLFLYSIRRTIHISHGRKTLKLSLNLDFLHGRNILCLMTRLTRPAITMPDQMPPAIIQDSIRSLHSKQSYGSIFYHRTCLILTQYTIHLFRQPVLVIRGVHVRRQSACLPSVCVAFHHQQSAPLI
jgi:hypothetical protein